MELIVSNLLLLYVPALLNLLQIVFLIVFKIENINYYLNMSAD